MNTIRLKIYAALALCCLAPLSAPSVQADEKKLIPSVEVREEYNDNLFLTQDNRLHDTITTVSPGLEYLRRSERGQIDLTGRVHSIHYADHGELDSTGEELSASGGYSLSELLWLGADTLWNRDAQLGRDLETTGLFNTTSRRTRKNYDLSGRLQLSERDMLQINAGLSQDRYSDPQFSDVNGKTGRLTWSSDFSRYVPNLVGQVLFDYGRYEYTTAKVNTYTLGIGGEKKMSEVWSVNGWLGPSCTETEYLFGTGLLSKDTSLSGNLGLERKWETGSLSLALSQSVAPDSGENGTVSRSSLSSSYTRQLTGDLSLGLDLRYFRNKTVSSNPSLNIDERSYQIAPKMSYRLTDDIRLESAYQHIYIDYKNDGTSRQQNLVFMKVVFSHRFH